MNILVVNGSPKGELSNTLHITQAFLEGLTAGSHDHQITTFTVKDKHIEFCTGCFHCWSHKDGKCIFKDDMVEYTELYKAADLIIFNTPVYYFGMPARLKNLLDRTLPFHLPEIVDRKEGGQRHDYRWDVGNKKIVLIATCGFYSYENNTEPLVKLFDICFGNACEKIICPEGTLFSLKVFEKETAPYLASARKAGAELAHDGRISDSTRQELIQRTFGVEDYLVLANNNWVKTDENTTEEEKKRLTVRQRIHQMPALFTGIPFTEVPTVIEMTFPALSYTCQMQMDASRRQVTEDASEFLPYHLRMVMDADRFISISAVRVNQKKGGNAYDPRKLAEFALRLQKMGARKEIKG
ncbi:MAG: flavodoxin family protein [Clostridia bacterium]|nr:flavodoxin family protein [Clostridia bacterium]